jgi:flavorubredoxin
VTMSHRSRVKGEYQWRQYPKSSVVFTASAVVPLRLSNQFNQFLIADEKPTLIHTGYYEAYDEVRSAIKQVLDPKLLAYVVLGHFEADECEGMNWFLAEAPGSVLIASELGAAVNLR